MKHSIIKKTEDYTEHTKAYFRLPNATTMETLITRLTTSEGAVLKKGERILVADTGRGGFLAGVYEMTETPEETGLGYIEWALRLYLLDRVSKICRRRQRS